MKKIYLLLFSVVIFFGVCFSIDENEPMDIVEESIDNINDNLIEIDNELDQIDLDESELDDEELSDNKKYGLGNISLGFCNEGDDNLSESFNYAVTQGKDFDVCILFYNSAPEDIKIRTRIVDQTLTAEGNKTCDYKGENIKNFISKDSLSELDELILPAEQYVKKVFSINFPVGVEGNIGACFSYYIPKKGENQEGAGFSVIVNNAYLMNFFVGGMDSIRNEILFEDLSTFKDDNGELNIKFNLINTGNLEDKIVINGTISNIFGFHKDFSIDGSLIQVKPGDFVPVTAAIGSIPSYGGLYNVKFTAIATPFFSYDISNSSIDPTLLEPKEFSASTTYFEIPWLILIILVVIILLLISMFRKPKEKVVYVQNPQQPIPNQGYQQPQYTQPQQPQYQDPQVQQPVQPQQPQYPNNPQYGQPMQQNPQPTPPQINPNN